MSNQVTVIGAGVVGLSTALAMAKQQFHVRLIDGKPIDERNASHPARVYALNATSQALLKHLEVWPKEEAVPYQSMKVWDGGTKADIQFDCRELGHASLGHIVSESALKVALIQQVKLNSMIDIQDGCRVHDITDGDTTAKLRLDNNEVLQSELVMIADGPMSPMRQHLKVPMNQWSYQQQAFIATVSCERPHQNIARQVFLFDSILAFLPLADSNQCAIVWSCQTNKAKQLEGIPEAAWGRILTKSFDQKMGAVQLLTQPIQFPLTLRHVKQYHGKHWMLLGDAAHTVHPMAGLGLNLGLADVRCWLSLMEAYPNQLASTRLLGQYQRSRKTDIWPVIGLLQGLKHLFNTDLSVAKVIRGQGLSWINQAPWLKKQLIDKAMRT